MSKILVTGGAGFIGSHLVDKLVALNHRVVVVNTISPNRSYRINPEVKLYQIDVRSPELADVFATEQPDYVFHLAAQIDVRKSVANPLLDTAVNVMGSINVFNNCLKYKVKKVVYFSTAGIYGDVVSPATEESRVQFDSPYALNKFAAETELQLLHKIHGLPYMVFRIANVYGPRQPSKAGDGSVIPIFIENALHNKTSFIYGDGLQTRDFVYVSDVVDACVLAIKDETVGTFNLGTGQATSILNLVQAIEQVDSKKMSLEYQPARPGEVKLSVLNFSKLHSVLGWRSQVNLAAGIAKTVAWWQKKIEQERTTESL